MQQLFGFTDRISTVLVMLTHMTQNTRMIRISSMTDSEDPESVKGSGFAICSKESYCRMRSAYVLLCHRLKSCFLAKTQETWGDTTVGSVGTCSLVSVWCVRALKDHVCPILINVDNLMPWGIPTKLLHTSKNGSILWLMLQSENEGRATVLSQGFLWEFNEYSVISFMVVYFIAWCLCLSLDASQ